MVFSPRLKISIVQNTTNKKDKSVNIIDGSVRDMLKTVNILEQRKFTTRSPEVLQRDRMMLDKLYLKLSRLGYI